MPHARSIPNWQSTVAQSLKAERKLRLKTLPGNDDTEEVKITTGSTRGRRLSHSLYVLMRR
jgi:hypothetical protein